MWQSDGSTTTDDEPAVRPRPFGHQSAYMKQREANIARNRAHVEELRDAFTALANMNSVGGSTQAQISAGGSNKAQERLAVKKLTALGDRLVKVC